MTPGPLRVMALVEAATISGSAKAVLEFAREAREANAPLELSIVTFTRDAGGNQFVEAVRERGIVLEEVRERGAFDTSVLSALRGCAARQGADIIWSNSVKSHFLVRLAGLHRRAGWLAFHHGYTFTDLKMKTYNQLDRWSLPAADRVLTVCQPFARQLESRGVRRKAIRVRHMSVRPFTRPSEPEVSDLVGRLSPSGAPVVLTVGRLSAEKGHADLIRAFALLLREPALADARLVIVGDGPEHRALAALGSDLGIAGDIHFAGQQADVRPFLAAAGLFVLPSHSEGSPNALLEAFAAGLPVVATRAGGIPEIATDGTDALLTAAGDSAALAAAMSTALRNAPLRKKLGAEALRTAERFAPRAYFEDINAVLREIAGSRKDRGL